MAPLYSPLCPSDKMEPEGHAVNVGQRTGAKMPCSGATSGSRCGDHKRSSDAVSGESRTSSTGDRFADLDSSSFYGLDHRQSQLGVKAD